MLNDSGVAKHGTSVAIALRDLHRATRSWQTPRATPIRAKAFETHGLLD
jgi:hypothetical protein